MTYTAVAIVQVYSREYAKFPLWYIKNTTNKIPTTILETLEGTFNPFHSERMMHPRNVVLTLQPVHLKV